MTVAQVNVNWQMNGKRVNAAFSLNAGVTALIGPSGAGKSSIARILTGLHKHANGTIALLGKTLLSDTVRIPTSERSIGLVMQDPSLFPTMTVRDNILIGCKLRSEQKLQEYLHATDTKRLMDRMPNTLSGGEARRVAIVRALAGKPNLLILDEPMSGLDPNRRRTMMSLIRQLAHHTQTPVLLVTHHLEEMLFAADDALLVSHGSILKSGSVDEVLSSPDTARLLGIDDAGSLVSASVIGREGGLIRADIGGQHLYLPDEGEPVGATLRLRILSRDVALAIDAVSNISILNQLQTTVADISKDEHNVTVTLKLEKSGCVLKSRITPRSQTALQIEKGKPLHALIKAVAVKEMVAES